MYLFIYVIFILSMLLLTSGEILDYPSKHGKLHQGLDYIFTSSIASVLIILQ